MAAMPERPLVLVIDDETGSRESMAIAIEKAGLAVRTFDDAADALTYLGENPGLARLAVCDLRIATTTLRFGFPIARTLGNCLSAGALSRLAALLGEGRLVDILFTSRLIESDEALAIGLVSEILADHEQLMQRAWALARQLCEHAPLTMRATKQILGRMRRAGPAVDDEEPDETRLAVREAMRARVWGSIAREALAEDPWRYVGRHLRDDLRVCCPT